MSEQEALEWAVKASFVGYVEGMADGVVSTSGGAIRLADGTFRFPLAAPSTADEILRFDGAVHLTGHFGMLNVSFAEPALARVNGELFLTIADPDAEGGRLSLLRLGAPVSDGQAMLWATPVLTVDGADLFFDSYRPGTAFDSLRVEAPSPADVFDASHIPT